MIDTPQCILSAPLIARLYEHHVTLLITNEHHQPILAQDRYHIEHQLQWLPITIKNIWQTIIQTKLLNQYRLLSKITTSPKQPTLTNITDTIEANYAQYYFTQLFGANFTRHSYYENDINKQLNYAYMILVHHISTQITAHNYLPQLGIHHRANENHENLSCDLIEPFRPIIDKYVYNHRNNLFDNECKHNLIEFLTEPITFNNTQYETIFNAINAYVTYILHALNNDLDIQINLAKEA